MALEGIKEGAKSPVLPFIGQANLSVRLVIAMVVGFMLVALIRPISGTLANAVTGFVAQQTGFDLQNGQSTGPAGGAFN